MNDKIIRLLEARVDELAGRIRQLEDRLGDGSEHRSAPKDAEGAGKRYLTVAEAAEYTGLSVSMLNRLRCDLPGGPPYSKIGARVLYAAACLDAWLEGRARPGRR